MTSTTDAGPHERLEAALAQARQVADAVLYEGHVLYPYRASAAKNQARWQWGVLAPRAHVEAEATDRWSSRCEVVVELPEAGAEVVATVRFLQAQARRVEQLVDGDFRPVPSLVIDGEHWTTWDEAVEHEVTLPAVPLGRTGGVEARVPVEVGAGREEEPLVDACGRTLGRVVRERWAVRAEATVEVTPPDGPWPLARVSVTLANTTPWAEAGARRDEALRRSLIGQHTVLVARAGAFVSLLDPPEFARATVEACTNEGTWPVLVGDEDERRVVLSSPIILYDHPAVAAESIGDFCDSTEIDEMLALRVLTLTDEEKAEARGTDPRARDIIDRCDDLPPEVMERLHGAVRQLRRAADRAEPEDPWSDSVPIAGVAVGRGTRVRLRPSHRADAHDLFLTGALATVEGVFADLDGGHHLAVVVDDDPGADLAQWQGRFLYFHPDEVEVVES
ncbi:MAG TPA: hypothetical protein VMN58_01945 [Acidimicrobiales bacterium]|nr:hypothetical protein [Acidimicrobiales bacterium]